MSIARLHGEEPAQDQPYPGAPFGVAFRRFWAKGFTFTGRASRAEFWKAYVATTLLIAVLYVLSSALSVAGVSVYYSSGSSGLMTFGNVLTWVALLYALVALVPSLAISWRRLHDANKSGAMYWLCLIPFAGPIVLLVYLAQEPDPAGARFDVDPIVTPASEGSGFGGAAAPPIPFAPGPAVPPPPPAAPAVAVPPPPPAAPVIAAAPVDLESTRLASPVAAAGWRIELPDGRSIPLTTAAYFGRAPIASGGEVNPLLVPVDDAAKSTSKTHARIVRTAAGIEITDLHSTNGTTVTSGTGTAISLAPGVGRVFTGDASVSFGSYVFAVRHQS